MWSWSKLSVFVGIGMLVSCAANDGRATDTGVTTTGTIDPTQTDTGDPDTGPDVFDVGDGDPGDGDGDATQCPCGENADLVYVLSDSSELWTYSPQVNQFTQLGTFDCGIPPTTFSMGVARSGTAWIMHRPDGDIFHVDVNNANQCSDPGYFPGQSGFDLFGMAFASNSAVDPCDKLYAHTFDDIDWSEGPGVGQLGRVDPKSLDLSPIGPINYNGGELTGTGDGRLFAFAGVPNAKLIEYDKSTGGEKQVIDLGGLQLTYAFAFAFWGGDFYFFTEGGGFGSNSKVTKLDFDESDGNGQALTTVNANAPMRIVGAGVSTCAPFVPPG